MELTGDVQSTKRLLGDAPPLPVNSAEISKFNKKYRGRFMTVLKFSSLGGFRETTFHIEGGGKYLVYGSGCGRFWRSQYLPFSNMTRIQPGQHAANFQLCIEEFRPAAHLSFSIYFKGFRDRGYSADKESALSIICQDQEQYDRFYGMVRGLMEEIAFRKSLLSQRSLYLDQLWDDADTNGNGRLSLHEVRDLCTKMNIALPYKAIKQKFEETDVDKSHHIEKGEFPVFIDSLCYRSDLQYVWDAIAHLPPEDDVVSIDRLDAAGYPLLGIFLLPSSRSAAPLSSVGPGNSMSIERFHQFLVNVQGETGLTGEPVTLKEAQDLVFEAVKAMGTDARGHGFDGLTLSCEVFKDYLSCSALNEALCPKHHGVFQDMTQPLSSYFIASSHNTYLEGDQWRSSSSTQRYISDMLNSCRCVELDCWDGSSGEPVITHGHTATGVISFRDAITAINQYAFRESPYPVILSIEQHCGDAQIEMQVSIMMEIFGEKLVHAAAPGTLKSLPSPEQLRHKILVKGTRGAVAEDDEEELEVLNVLRKVDSLKHNIDVTKQFKDIIGQGLFDLPGTKGASRRLSMSASPTLNAKAQPASSSSTSAGASTGAGAAPHSPASVFGFGLSQPLSAPTASASASAPSDAKQHSPRTESKLSMHIHNILERESQKHPFSAEHEHAHAHAHGHAGAGSGAGSSSSSSGEHDSLLANVGAGVGVSNAGDAPNPPHSSSSSSSSPSPPPRPPRPPHLVSPLRNSSDITDENGSSAIHHAEEAKEKEKKEKKEKEEKEEKEKKEADERDPMTPVIFLATMAKIAKFSADTLALPCDVMSSYGEVTAHAYSEDPARLAGFVAHNVRHMSRVYPKGMRIDSSNYMPTIGWRSGAQLVALNYQTADDGMFANFGMFRQNGRCGYVLKPAYQRHLPESAIVGSSSSGAAAGGGGGGSGSNSPSPTRAAAKGRAEHDQTALQAPASAPTPSAPIRLQIHILGGSQIPKPGGANSGEVINPFVIIDINGAQGDSKRYTTAVVNKNGFSPMWNEISRFDIGNPDMAIMTVKVMDANSLRSDFIGFSSYPIAALRQGVRIIQLRDSSDRTDGDFAFARLFVRISVCPLNPARAAANLAVSIHGDSESDAEEEGRGHGRGKGRRNGAPMGEDVNVRRGPVE